MGSSYFGEPNLGNERSGSGSSSSRKGKKSNSDKPKQPQRGLGVAQLEKIRLHSQMGCSYLPSLHTATPYSPNFNQEDMSRLQIAAYSAIPSSSSSSSLGFHGHQNIMMGLGELERSANIRYGDSQPITTKKKKIQKQYLNQFICSIHKTRWNPGNGILESQHFAQPSMTTTHLLNLQAEDSLQKKRKKDRSNSFGSSSQNSESNDNQELDLELRLSL
ncbi:protein SPEAR1-like [Cornus florida]|uniref:protein SPEAR1-like n=1 Tax=Cornus florida TaxID=4283 RepID=UPI0028968288|nr:protein SPEAR1-like [Cornus florida]